MKKASDCNSVDRTRLTLVLLIICFLYQFACMNMSVTLYDEGVILVGAMRVTDGEIPHRDFYSNYGPGQFYVLAGLFKLFSPSVLIERIWDTVARTISVVAVFLIVARATRSTVASLGTAFVCMIWCASFGSYGYPVFPALAAAVLSLSFAFGRSHATWPLLTAGGFSGLAFLFRYDIGVFTFLVLALVLGLCVISTSLTTGKVLRDLVRVVTLFSAGFAAIALPVIAAFAAYGAVGDLLFDVVVFPSKYYPQTRSLPFPNFRALVDNPADIVVYMPLILLAAAIPSILSAGRRNWENTHLRLDRSATTTWCWLAVALVSMTLVYFGKGVVRVSPIHMAMAIVASLVLTGITATKISTHAAFSRGTSFVALLLAAFCTTAALADNVHRAWDNVLALIDGDFWATPAVGGQSQGASCRVPSGLERLACFSVDRNHMNAIRFLQERTKPGDYIYVGLGRHDKILMNDVTMYFLSQLRPATKWHQFDPGLQTSAIVQREIISELQHNHPRFVVLESQWDSAQEPNASALSSGVLILDDYIRDHFEVVARFDTVSVLVDAAL